MTSMASGKSTGMERGSIYLKGDEVNKLFTTTETSRMDCEAEHGLVVQDRVVILRRR